MTTDRSLRLAGVGVRLGTTDALREVGCEIDASRVAVIGHNGSGKSTFARVVGGLLAPTSGELRVHGLDPRRDARALRRRTAFIFSNPAAQIVMPTVREDLAYTASGFERDRARRDELVAATLERVGLAEHAETPAHSLSGGQQQLLALANAFIREPSLIVADEPTAYLDAANTRRIARALLRDAPEAGAQVVVVTHDLELAAHCDVALRFEGGRLEAVGEPAALIEAYARDVGPLL